MDESVHAAAGREPVDGDAGSIRVSRRRRHHPSTLPGRSEFVQRREKSDAQEPAGSPSGKTRHRLRVAESMTTLDFGPLVLGGNTFGWSSDRDESFAVLDAFVDAGGRSIDTADVYSEWAPGNTGGDSERILGEWLTSRGRRDDVVIATKVSKASARPGTVPRQHPRGRRRLARAPPDRPHRPLLRARRRRGRRPGRLRGCVRRARRRGEGRRGRRLELLTRPAAERARPGLGCRDRRLHRVAGPVQPRRPRHRGRAAAHDPRPGSRRAALLGARQRFPQRQVPAGVRRSTRCEPAARAATSTTTAASPFSSRSTGSPPTAA